MNKYLKVGIGIFIFVIIAVIGFASSKKMEKEDIIQEFYESKQEFMKIKEYLITNENAFFISEGNYKDAIDMDNIKESFEYIFKELEFTRVMQEVTEDGNKIIEFTKVVKEEEFMVIYSKEPMNFGMESEMIVTDWYYSWIGY